MELWEKERLVSNTSSKTESNFLSSLRVRKKNQLHVQGATVLMSVGELGDTILGSVAKSSDSTNQGDMVLDSNVEAPDPTYDLFTNMDIKNRLKGKNINQVVLISLRERSLYNSGWIIYDSGSNVNLIRDLSMFSSPPVPIQDDEVPIVGFDTSFGSATALAKGTLKWPLEGVVAYYSQNCIGNIISEFVLRDTHSINDYENKNKMLDRKVAVRLIGADDSTNLNFSRGLEGIFVCSLDEMTKNVVDSTNRLIDCPAITDFETSVTTWMSQQGLTSREINCALVFESLSCEARNQFKRVLLGGLGLNTVQCESFLCKLELVKGRVPDLISHRSKRQLTDILPQRLSELRLLNESEGEILKNTSSLSGSGVLTWNYCGQCSSENINEMDVSSGTVRNTEEPSRESKVRIDISPSNAQTASTTSEERNGRFLTDCCKLTGSQACDRYRTRSKPGYIIPHSGSQIPEGKYNFSEREMCAAFLLGVLKPNVGELAVSLFVVDWRLTGQQGIVGLTLAQRGLSNRSIDRVAAIERLHKLTSYTSLENLGYMIKHGLLGGIDGSLSIKDVDNYSKYVHALDCACILGKIKAPPAMRFDINAHYPHTCHCDAFQLTSADKTNKYFFFVGVDAATQFVMVTRIVNTSTQELQRAISHFIKIYKRWEQTLKHIFLDNAAGLLTESMNELVQSQGVVPLFSTPNLHVRVAEATVKVIKSLARTTIMDWTTARRFITAFVPYLVNWVAQSVNFCLRTDSQYASPFVRFTGKPVSLEVHLRFAFLDTVAFHKTASTGKVHNLESRGKLGLVVARNGEAGAHTILDLETMRECKRYHLKLVGGADINNYVNSKLVGSEFRVENIADAESDIVSLPVDDLELTPEALILVREQIGGWTRPIFSSDTSSHIESTNLTSTQESSAMASDHVSLFTIEHKTHGMRSRQDSDIQVVKPVTLTQNQAFAEAVPENGSCMFHSVAKYFMSNSKELALFLRLTVCDFIDANPHYTLESGISISEIIKSEEPGQTV